MGSSKARSPTGDRDAEVAKLRERVSDLERERERLIHSTRKAENMAEKKYLFTQQYFSMIKNKEDKNEKHDTEVAQLLREAKTNAEREEENANTQVRNLQTKLDDMSKRALEAEDALKDEKHQRETDTIRFRAEADKSSGRVKENQMLRERFQRAIETITTLHKELKQMRGAAQASGERETNLIQLLQDMNLLVAGIISNSHEISDRLTSCCSNLGELLGVVGRANVAVSNALVASQQGVRFVISELGDLAQLKLLPGSFEGTLGRMKKEGYRGLTQFLSGADLDGVRHQMKESGKLVVMRSLEDQGQEANESAILRWREFYEDFVWTPETTIISQNQVTQFFFSIVTATAEDQLCRQLKRLHLDVSAEADVVGNQLELAQESHEACESYVEVWKGYYNKWMADQAELAVSVTEAVDELSAQNLPKS
ncbi:hypothetical protein PR001_g24187 [Phytophthora rubi]|uniref:Uncharacterized protein n=1 Tax=Phytophthora rubi TaxID=129364 RepID=A0A6A3IJP1_9STRA|nr:hypothetical protein PR001_g24187 [Phytophthora rubi]